MTVMYEGAYAGCWTAACVNTNFLVNRPLFQNKLAEYTASIFSFVTNMGGYDGFGRLPFSFALCFCRIH